MIRLIIKYSGFLLVGFLIVRGLIFVDTLYNLAYFYLFLGFFILLLILTILILLNRQLIRFDKSFSISRLTLTGIVVCFIAQFIFMLFVLFTLPFFINHTTPEQIHNFLIGMLYLSFLISYLSFCVAFQTKIKKATWLIFFIFIFFIILISMGYFIPK